MRENSGPFDAPAAQLAMHLQPTKEKVSRFVSAFLSKCGKLLSKKEAGIRLQEADLDGIDPFNTAVASLAKHALPYLADGIISITAIKEAFKTKYGGVLSEFWMEQLVEKAWKDGFEDMKIVNAR